jgi:small-conductance mechanosensitive channel
MNIPTLEQFIFAALILVAARILSSLVVAIIKRSKALTSKTETTLDDTILRLIRRPLHFGFQMMGIVIAAEYLFPTFTYEGYGYGDLIMILIIAWIAYTVNRVIRGLMSWKEAEADLENPNGVSHGTFGFLYTIISMLVWGLGLAFVLNQLGVDISALLAGLGIAGIAVALALQNTLSGLFSAVGLALDRPIRQGDYIRLENGTEGFVEDISMRSTRIRTFQKTLVIIPNSKITSMIIENTYMPAQEVSLKIPVGVSYGADLEQAEKIALMVAEEVLSSFGKRGDSDPFVRFTSFGDSSIEMNVFLHVHQFLDQYVIRHNFIKKLKVVFEKEGIEIPYPQMEVHLNK